MYRYRYSSKNVFFVIFLRQYFSLYIFRSINTFLFQDNSDNQGFLVLLSEKQADFSFFRLRTVRRWLGLRFEQTKGGTDDASKKNLKS